MRWDEAEGRRADPTFFSFASAMLIKGLGLDRKQRSRVHVFSAVICKSYRCRKVVIFKEPSSGLKFTRKMTVMSAFVFGHYDYVF